jgi:hypothetical protein
MSDHNIFMVAITDHNKVGSTGMELLAFSTYSAAFEYLVQYAMRNWQLPLSFMPLDSGEIVQQYFEWFKGTKTFYIQSSVLDKGV